MNDFVRIKNNEAIKLSQIPKVTFATFSDQLAPLMDGNVDVLACFVANRPDQKISGDLELFTLIGCRATNDIAVFRCDLATSYPSLTCRWPQFHLFEREIAEQYGVIPEGHPWLKPVRFHSVWQGDKDAWGRDPKKHPLVGDMEYFQVQGDEIHEVGVGPVHAGIIEPGHFRFQCFGEVVLNLEISLGFQHRGTEKLFCGGPHAATPYQMETLAGDTSVGHMTAYSQIMETLAACKVSKKARILREVGLELERLANHVGDIGAMALDIGFLPTSSFCGRIRGDYLNMTAQICGSRFGRGLVRPGGVLFHLDRDECDSLLANLEKTNRDTLGALNLFFRAPSVLSRLEGTGTVPQESAIELGITGMAGRACNLDTDSRRLYPTSPQTGDEYPLLCGEDGDAFSRAYVRQVEIDAATEQIREKLAGFPSASGSIMTEISSPQPDMLAVSLVEGWRGRLAHIVLTDGAGKFKRYKVIDPSFYNWSGLGMALRNEEISDFPICNKSFNLSYCGFDL